MTKQTADLVERLTTALGVPTATPEWVQRRNADGKGCRMIRSHYRVFRWDCPACHAGELDEGIMLAGKLITYRPFFVDSDGLARCNANDCNLDQIAQEVAIKLGARQLAETLRI